MTDELLSKIKKIKALVDIGVDGEKQSAEELLTKLLDKYNIYEEDLLEDIVKEYEFYCYGQFGIKLFSQIVYSVNPNIKLFRYTYKRSDCKTRLVRCTQAEFIEISEMYDFYRHHLDKGLEMYFNAFIQAEKIFPDGEKYPETISKEPYRLTEEDMKMLQIVSSLEKHDRLLKLEAGDYE